MQPETFAHYVTLGDHHWWFVARRQITARLLARLLAPGSTVADVGCGTGITLKALAGSYECIGSDSSEAAIDHARRAVPGAAFYVGHMPPEVIRLADAVLLMDVIEHVEDDLLAVSTILAEMREGSHMLLTVPAHDALWSPSDITAWHYRRYSRERFAAVWDGLPVTVRLLSYFNVWLSPLVWARRALSKLRRKERGGAAGDLVLPRPAVNRILTRVFASEGSRLVRLLDRPVRRLSEGAYPTGVSLVAVLRRDAGRIPARAKSGRVPPDRRPSPCPLAGDMNLR